MNRKLVLILAAIGVILIAGLGVLLANKNESTVDNNSDQTTTQSSKLVNQPWVWQNVAYSDDKTISVKTPESFILVLNNDGTFSSTTDCNNLVGKYLVDSSSITFNNIASTMMFCDGSQEQEFSAMLQDVKSYSITSEGNLQLQLKTNNGIANFSKN